MIKIDLPIQPAQLTPALQARLTQEFKNTGNPVWNIEWLKKAIYDMAFGKCCYSEIRLGEESKYMEVEHFYPKSRYPDQVIKWGNLVPSNKKSNATKGELDTVREPIVNPFVDNPKDYFYFKDGRYRAKDTQGKGKRTIIKLALNDWNHFVLPRFNLAEQIMIELKERQVDFEKIADIVIPINRIKRLMRTGNRKEEYSALVSTAILSNVNFQTIETLLKNQNLWDTELEALKAELEFCALME
jgi:CRISPR/Cas system Type II protein with McrA/HNH and RuvC-like nuclease domain